MPLITPQIVKNATATSLGPGSIISFNYLNPTCHDPSPTIIVASIYNRMLHGLNLHYMTFPVFRVLLNQWAGNPSFNYNVVKNMPIITQSFRSYKFNFVKSVKLIDWKSLAMVLSNIRNYSPQEVARIREAVDHQIMSRTPEIINEIVSGIQERSNI